MAEAFNNYFVDQVIKLKEGIKPNLISDPLTKLAAKMENNKNRFSLKKITQHKLKKTIKQLKRKKSSWTNARTTCIWGQLTHPNIKVCTLASS